MIKGRRKHFLNSLRGAVKGRGGCFFYKVGRKGEERSRIGGLQTRRGRSEGSLRGEILAGLEELERTQGRVQSLS